MTTRTALFSLFDPSCAVRFARELISEGWRIVSSRETTILLQNAGLPTEDIADFTGVHEQYGFPPTLHPRVEAALTGAVSPCIDLVFVMPYPPSQGLDIGGRTLLALAVKGGRIAVAGAEDMERVLMDLAALGQVSPQLQRELADKACSEAAAFYAARVHERGAYDGLNGRHALPLLYGENPYQTDAAMYVIDREAEPLALTSWRQVAGDMPCYTNMADADALLYALCLAAEAFRRRPEKMPYLCVAAKHGNPCGMGMSRLDPAEALEKALFGNPLAIWGGEVMTNFALDGALADRLFRSERRRSLCGDAAWMLDLVAAPSFSDDALDILARRKARKLFAAPALESPTLPMSRHSYRKVRGGFLRQTTPRYILELSVCRREGRALTLEETDALILAWAAAFSSSHGGNEIAIARDGALIGAGGGPSTMDAAQTAVTRARAAGHEVCGSVFAADAFFPFVDAPSVLCDAGIVAGCVPQGGKNENDVIELFRDRRVAMAYLPEAIRGFCRH